MKPWGTRQTLVVKGRQDTQVTIVVEVYRRKVWLTVIDVPFVAEAILEPGQADGVAELLTQAATEARGKQPQDRRNERRNEAAHQEDATGGTDAADSAAVDP